MGVASTGTTIGSRIGKSPGCDHTGRMDYETFRAAVSARLLAEYCLTWDDAAGDPETLIAAMGAGWSPEQFVERYGMKYDLTPHHDLFCLADARARRG